MRREFEDDEELYDRKEEKSAFYHLKVKRGWFRKKDVFTNRMSYYERQLLDLPEVHPPLNAGNMIYVMMRRLEIGVEWEKQDALIGSYRNLMYKMSYVDVVWQVKDRGYLHIMGQKNDVMWALAFLTQVFPEDPMECEVVTLNQFAEEEDGPLRFSVQNGTYVGDGAAEAQLLNDALPDIWAVDPRSNYDTEQSDALWLEYSPEHRPQAGDAFALPDGRIGEYVRMDERYRLADQYGSRIDIRDRHNISASLMKDFEDLVRRQTRMDYDLYQMRYVAYMNKVHELEHLLRGLEVSVYDVLPVGERGLPYAEIDTVQRTNLMDCESLKYIIDKVDRNRFDLNDRERKKTMKEAGESILYRLSGYDTEYQMYQATGTAEDLCRAIHNDKCYELYVDVAKLESYGILVFPDTVYKALCNEPSHSVFQMTDFEKQKLRLFGRGYADFLAYQVQHMTDEKLLTMYKKAWIRLQKRFLRKKK